MGFFVLLCLVAGAWVLFAPMIALLNNSSLRSKVDGLEKEISKLRRRLSDLEDKGRPQPVFQVQERTPKATGEPVVQEPFAPPSIPPEPGDSVPPPIPEASSVKPEWMETLMARKSAAREEIPSEVSPSGLPSSDVATPEAPPSLPQFRVLTSKPVPPVLNPLDALERIPSDLPPPRPIFAAPRDTDPEALPGEVSFETRVGTVWALRLGLALLAIGLGFLAKVVHPMLSPGAKVAIAYAGAMGLVAIGRVYANRLKFFARPMMAGGLSLGFFISFAAHFIEPMQCLPLWASLAWMSGGVLSMFAAAQRWRSPRAAMLGIALGHVAAFVAAGEADYFSLISILFLSVAAIMMFLLNDWPVLSIFGVTAAYVSHAAWGLANHPVTTPEAAFWVNIGFLSSYFVIFAASDLIWWKRHGAAGLANRDGQSYLAARASGPLNIICYLAFVGVIHYQTEIHWNDIHIFLFIFAAVQAVYGYAQRRFGNRDYIFYPSLAVILITVGGFSALAGPGLNMMLAGEALILLLAAHRTRIWTFHLLAQAVLAVNFIHYWTRYLGPEESATIGLAIGNLMVAGVYFLKAELEALWYGPEDEGEWFGPGASGPISSRLAKAFSAIFKGIAPQLPYLHAMGGGLMIAHTLFKYETLLLPIEYGFPAAIAALLVLSCVRRTAPAICGILAIEAAAVALSMKFMVADPREVGMTFAFICATAAIATGFTLVDIGVGRIADAKQRRIALNGAGLVVLLALPISLPWVARIDGASTIEKLDGLGLAFGFFAFHELVIARMRRKALGFEAIQVFQPLAHCVLCIGASLILHRVTTAHYGASHGATAALAAWAAVALVLAAWRRDAGYISAWVVLLATAHLGYYGRHAYHLFRPDAGEAGGFAIAIATILTFAMAGGLDMVVTAGRRILTSSRRNLGELAAYVTYALGFLMMAHRIEVVEGFPFGPAEVGAGCLAVAAVAGFFRMRRGLVSAFVAWALLAQGAFILLMFRAIVRGGAEAALIPSLLLLAESIAIERVLAWGRGIQFDNGKTDVTLQARSILLGASLFAVLVAAYNSSALGAGHEGVTAFWGGLGVAIMVLGFVFKSSVHRRAALAVLAIALVRVFVVDVRELPDFFKTLAFISLGLCLCGVAWLYSRFSEEIKKWL